MTYLEFLVNIRKMKTEGFGLMDINQYYVIGNAVSVLSPCNLLIFGLGHDSIYWDKLNKNGTTVFIEDNKEWIEKFVDKNLQIVEVTYNTDIKDHEKIGFNEDILHLALPSEITDKQWDMIFVDAPLGHGPPGRSYNGPGRMQSIFMAHKLLKEAGICIIDDYNRVVERKYSNHYFGDDNIITLVKNKLCFFKKEMLDG